MFTRYNDTMLNDTMLNDPMPNDPMPNNAKNGSNYTYKNILDVEMYSSVLCRQYLHT
jgi:hypothetical protein